MAVDREVFRTQGHLIEDSLNIMWADQETRSPHHPLRDLNLLFGYNADLNLWGFRDNVLDAVYDNGSYPSRAPEPMAAVTNAAPITPTGTILKADSASFNDPAVFELYGDYLIGSNGSITVAADVIAIGPSAARLSAAGFAAQMVKAIIDFGPLYSAYQYGSKVFVRSYDGTPIILTALIIS